MIISYLGLFLILENILEGSTANNIDTQKFIGEVSNRMYTNSIGNFKTYFNDFKFVSFTNDSESIGRFKIDLTKKSYLYESYSSYYLIFDIKQGKWDNNVSFSR